MCRNTWRPSGTCARPASTIDVYKRQIVGPSGAGKTTLLNILGGMDTCDEGHVWLDGQDVSHFSEKELTTYRRYDVGFVFQFYNLVQNLSLIHI